MLKYWKKLLFKMTRYRVFYDDTSEDLSCSDGLVRDRIERLGERGKRVKLVGIIDEQDGSVKVRYTLREFLGIKV